MSGMRIFISGPFRKKEHRLVLEAVKETLAGMGHSGFIGAKEIDNYREISMTSRLFWGKIVKEMKNCDIIISDFRDVGSGFGRAIEIGIAKAFGKRIILLYPTTFKTDKCVEDIADKIIPYKDLSSLQEKLKKELLLK